MDMAAGSYLKSILNKIELTCIPMGIRKGVTSFMAGVCINIMSMSMSVSMHVNIISTSYFIEELVASYLNQFYQMVQQIDT